MDLKINKALLLLLAVFLTLVYGAAATVTVGTVVVTPLSPVTTDVLDCSFIITGNQTSYSANVTWFLGGVAQATDTETLTVLNATQTSTSATGDVEAADTRKGQSWICRVTASDNSNNTATGTSAAVIVGNSAPTLSSVGTRSVNINRALTFSLSGSDADVTDGIDSLVFSKVSGPAALVVSPQGLVTWTPTDNETGSHSVTVRVTDGVVNVDQTFTITVSAIMISLNNIDGSCTPKCSESLSASNAMNNGDAGRFTDVRPGSTLTVRARVENLWDDNLRDHEILDIILNCELEDIGDEDEQEEEIDFGDLDPGERSSRETMTFNIPLDAEEDTYVMDCFLEAEDEDGTDYRIQFDIDVEVEKEDHKLIFRRLVFEPTVVSCNRRVTLTRVVQNIGSRDERDVIITSTANTINFNNRVVVDEIEEGDFDDDDTIRRDEISFIVPDSVAPGTYTIRNRVEYDRGGEVEIQDIDLVVQECRPAVIPSDDDDDDDDDSQQPPVVVVTPPTTPTQQPGQAVATPVTTVRGPGGSIEAFLDSPWFIVLLVVVILALLGLGIWMVTLLLK